MSSITAGFQWVNFIGSIAVLAFSIALAWRFPREKWLMFVPAMWAGYGVVFYAALLSGQLTADEVLLWGAIHRTLAVSMGFGGLWAMWMVLVDGPPEGGDRD